MIAHLLSSAGSTGTAEVRAHETAATRVIDLGGRRVVPGLADNHLHSAGCGAGVDLSGARTLAEVLSAIAAAVREAAPGAVVLTNSDWHEAQLAEQRLAVRRTSTSCLIAGKLADLVVLSHDILTCSDEELRHARVSMTMVGGEIVYEAVED